MTTNDDLPKVYQQILIELIEEYNLVCGLAALSDGTELARAGNFSSLQNQALINTLTFDSQTIARLDNSLKDQILPRIWNQDQVFAFAAKPDECVVVIFFAENEQNAIAHYHHSRVVNSALNDKIHKKTEN